MRERAEGDACALPHLTLERWVPVALACATRGGGTPTRAIAQSARVYAWLPIARITAQCIPERAHGFVCSIGYET